MAVDQQETRLEQKLAWQRNYYKTHKEAREKHAEQGRNLNRQRKVQVLSHYSNGEPKCNSCGITDIDVLALDHINGGGNKHRKSISLHCYPWIIKNGFPDGFQVLCHNCNWKKHLTQLREHKKY